MSHPMQDVQFDHVIHFPEFQEKQQHLSPVQNWILTHNMSEYIFAFLKQEIVCNIECKRMGTRDFFSWWERIHISGYM